MGEMIAQNASNKDSRSLNEPRDVGRRKRIGHSPPTNIPVTSLGPHLRTWRLHFWETFRRKWGRGSCAGGGIKKRAKIPLIISTTGCGTRAAKEKPRVSGA